ncbi:NADH-dependent flavin oxidoreductase [Myxozyma melibiosi]|uniref:NADH-dependent flavin oxidoreductase n=1 Tax=Myxozyma melibiosi TaxID=54550 RepID=A0ABR1F9U6_9ASCO
MSEVIVKAAEGVSFFTPAQEPPVGTCLAPAEGKEVPTAFQPLTIRGVTFQNRIWVSPMCQYSYDDGFLTDWAVVHYGSFAARGASLTMIEATAVLDNGGITPGDSGLWKDEQIEPLKRIVDFVHSQGQKIGIQLAHAGRKGSTMPRWTGVRYAHAGAQRGFPDRVVAPSAISFADTFVPPRELTTAEVEEYIEAFKKAAERAVKAGVDVVEIHGAHGYLLNQFLSPVSNKRTDEYGGSFENRIRFPVEIVKAVKSVLPENILLFFRTSATDNLEHIEPLGVDLLDVSTGGNDPRQLLVGGPAYQAKHAYKVKEECPKIFVAPVGAVHEPDVIETVLEKADAFFVARPFSWDPSFVLTLAKKYGITVKWPVQYGYYTSHAH